MTPTLHPQLLSAFLEGKSCATIATTFSLSVEEVLAWFESGLTQSTLRRLESLQLQQARIVSFSVLPGAADSLTDTCHTADNPLLRTRAASNLVRLGLRFSAPHSRNSEAPSLRERVGGRETAPSTPDAFMPTASADRAASQAAPRSSPPSDPFVPSVSSAPPAAHSPTDHICESLRAEFAALRTPSTNALRSSSRVRNARSRDANHRTESAPRREPAREQQTLSLESAPTPEPVAPLFSRRESRIASLRSSAGAIASCDPFSALNRAPPRNFHSPPPINSAA